MPYDFTVGAGDQWPYQAGLNVDTVAGVSTAAPPVSDSTRLKVSSSNGGDLAFVLNHNPYIYDASDSMNLVDWVEATGNLTYMTRPFDSRLRKLTWSGYLVDSTAISVTADYFRYREGQIRYFNFGNMSSTNARWITASDWKKARIIDVKVNYKRGGILRYDTLDVIIQPER